MPPVKTRMRLRLAFLAFSGSLAAVAVVACGARTGLPVDGRARYDAGADVVDEDAIEEDVADVVEEDVIEEDAPVVPPPTSCADAGVTYIYVVTQQNELLHFYPPDKSFASNGPISCPVAGNPFSMAVDRSGIALVLFDDVNGTLFRVDPAAMSCTDTGFVSGQNGFAPKFGMGFSADTGDPGETLFVAADNTTSPLPNPPPMPSTLAQIDTVTFNLSVVGMLPASIGDAELTGTGDGKLYAFGVDNAAGTTHLAQIDKASATVLSDVTLPITGMINAWAFGYWGGKFYFFTSMGGGSTVSEYDPVTGAFDPSYASTDETIVGAGVSTCAPL
jgi:hypothetical protein